MGSRFREYRHLAVLVGVFIVSRVFLASTTGPFNLDPLRYFWQYADPTLLREDLLRTVFYLHSQPPLFNLFLGVGLKLFPESSAQAFGACQTLVSLGFAVSLFELMRRLTVPKTLALFLTGAFILSPPYLSYENWLFYDLYAAALLCGTALFFHRFVSTGRSAAALVTVTLAATLALTVPSFHYLWVLAVACALCLLGRRKWRKILIVSAVPVLLVLGVHLKNLLVFGHFSVDTYFVAGNLAFISVNRVPLPLRKQLVAQGLVSDFSLSQPFEPYHGPKPTASLRRTGVSVLDTETKSTGAVNLHSKLYLDMSGQLTRDSVYVARNYPEFLSPVSSKLVAWLTLPSVETGGGIPRYRKLEAIAGSFPFSLFGPSIAKGVLPVVLLVPLAYALLVVLRGLEKKRDKPFLAGLGYLAITIIGFNLPLILFTWEVHRYRYRTDALSLVLLAVLLAHIGRVARRRWLIHSRRSGLDSSPVKGDVRKLSPDPGAEGNGPEHADAPSVP